MSHLRGVELQPLSLEIFEPVLGRERVDRVKEVAELLRERLSGRVFWNVNTTAVGGGVAEMLQSLLRYARGAGIDTRWLVMGGNPDFFRLTKRLHHALHGSSGDGSPLDDAARRVYEGTAAAFAAEAAACVQPGDLVLLHDPQTAGLAPHMLERGARVIWRCHVGHDDPGPEVDRAWGFLAPYLEGVPAFVFSRRAYVPDFCDHGRATIIQPSIDAFATKNRELDEATIRTALVHTGLVEGPPPEPAQHAFVRGDGTPGRIERRADIVRLDPVVDGPTVLALQNALEDVQVTEAVIDYCVALVHATRASTQVHVGASPRGVESLIKLARARATIAGRGYVIPDDVKAVAVPALAHRVVLLPELWVRGADSASVVAECLATVPTPPTLPSPDDAAPR